jgi:hypothetical protein
MIFYKMGKIYQLTISSINLSPALTKSYTFFDSNTILAFHDLLDCDGYFFPYKVCFPHDFHV